MKESIERRIVEIVSEQAEVEPASIKPDATLDDLDLPSITQIEILYAIEEAFDIDLPEHLEDLSLNGLSQLVARYVAEKGADA